MFDGPQGSVQGPLLFSVYINDLGDGISSKISKFADDTEISRKVSKEEDVEEFRTNLNKLFEWSRERQVLFNVNKCSAMHMRSRNGIVKCEFWGTGVKPIRTRKRSGSDDAQE